jgi:hypothetical protein
MEGAQAALELQDISKPPRAREIERLYIDVVVILRGGVIGDAEPIGGLGQWKPPGEQTGRSGGGLRLRPIALCGRSDSWSRYADKKHTQHKPAPTGRASVWILQISHEAASISQGRAMILTFRRQRPSERARSLAESSSGAVDGSAAALQRRIVETAKEDLLQLSIVREVIGRRYIAAPGLRVTQLFHSKVALQDGPFILAEYRHTSASPYVQAESMSWYELSH